MNIILIIIQLFCIKNCVKLRNDQELFLTFPSRLNNTCATSINKLYVRELLYIRVRIYNSLCCYTCNGSMVDI